MSNKLNIHQQLSFNSLFGDTMEPEDSQPKKTEQQTFSYKRNRKTYPINLVRDFEKFLSYLESHTIKLTKTNGYISKKNLPYINDQLSLKAEDVTNHSQQEYYPYIHFFFHLALSAGLLERKHPSGLSLTERWRLFQKLSETEQYCFLLETFWMDLDWSILTNKTYSSIHMMLPEVLEKITDERAGNILHLDQNPIFSRFLYDWNYFLLYFEWFGLWICERDQVQMERYGTKSNYFAKTLTLTTFGTKMFPILMQERNLYQWNIPLRRRTFGEINPFPGSPLPDEEKEEVAKTKPAQFYESFTTLFPRGCVHGSLPRRERKFVSGLHTFKVAFSQNVWRSVVLSANHTMEDLHNIIIEAYQFDNDHLYAFFMDGKRWSEDCIVSPLDDSDHPNSAEVKIGSVGMRSGQQFMYMFDYGDEWTFMVTIMDIQEGEPEPVKPFIKAVKGEAPEQYFFYEEFEGE
ncbi:IS1096 element passenger TnpR family protein [Terrihalobacillus insolitus]|uniref:IS1096 element passenger TnpR family protein n=1 Tax=Terrihalobacillus insolitus TaxID=2950438 RepID=UPI00233F90EF|nr:plasmid pRiA4b ORF-3 family protein [Terrihalobacillus insolitus]MDC3413891.1 plasmid pRiA4b ORF-3 family protein [Terrihalobacillus insolitus]